MTFSPTPEQQTIIDFLRTNPDSSLMVDARAGAAKTSTIVMACQGMDNVKGGVLALAFNVRIKKELEERVPPFVTCLTLNGLGHRAWAARLNKRLRVNSDKMFKIAKDLIPADLRQEDDELFSDALALARGAKSAGLVPIGTKFAAPSLLPDTDKSWENLAFERGFHAYTEAVVWGRRILEESISLSFKGEIDFDDQIYMPVLFGGIFPRYHTVIVDEAQDLSPLNHRQLSKTFTKRLIAVGDPYQAIYAFRGADSNSMTNMLEDCNTTFERLGLTYSFRCPKIVAERQRQHVPDFKAWETNPTGVIEDWTLGLGARRRWSCSDIPHQGAIICRNNAPLMKMAFTLIKQRRPVKILGRDIGAQLAKTLLKITNKDRELSLAKALDLLHLWRESELRKIGDSESKRATIEDRYECLQVLIDASGCKTVGEAADFITDLFQERGEDLVLCSGHKAKGLEWDWVMHLDPFRCPSKFAIHAAEEGNPSQLIQEHNLKYVIETRTKHTLVMANLNDCEEVGA